MSSCDIDGKPLKEKDFSSEDVGQKAVMIYDGDCGFCLFWMKKWALWTQNKISYTTSQASGHLFPEIPADIYDRAVVFVDEDGKWWEGAAAISASFEYAKTVGLFPAAYGFPPSRVIMDAGYRVVANNRRLFSKLTGFFLGKSSPQPQFSVGMRLFMAGLGLSFFFGFLSFALEAAALVGPDGILPLDPFMQRLARNNGSVTFTPGLGAFFDHLTTAPSFTWLSSDLDFLYGLCGIAMLCSIGLIFGFMPGPLCVLLWLFYLSITMAGQRFYYFQWDNLILETGLLAACVLPFLTWWATKQQLGRLPILFFGFLLFKIVLSSAMAKWNSGDDSWHNLTALTYHYETQPLPTPLAFIFHQAPLWFHQFSCLVTFVVQMGAPFLLFMPRRLRHAGALAIFLHQILIAITGNYNFFNVLTMSLCLSQLDDDFYRWAWRRTPALTASSQPQNPLKYLGYAAATLITLLSFGRMCEVVMPQSAPKALSRWADDVRRFRSINTYGLFARMTKTRPEITLQGSADGEVWKDYAFHHKPGPLDRWPTLIAPLQPRVDWQMWFAALGNAKRNPWLTKMMHGIFAHQAPLLKLFSHNPFPDAPPLKLRAIIQNYAFRSWEQYRQDGLIWQKETPRLYHPVMENKASRR